MTDDIPTGNFLYFRIEEKMVKFNIDVCSRNGHFQQVVYSVHGNCLTQVCFDCKRVRSNKRK